MRRFFRFSIRDLLWLTLLVAMGLGWFVHQRQLGAETKKTNLRREQAEEMVRSEREARTAAEKEMTRMQRLLDKLGEPPA